jgi:hypothetical protein
MSQLIVYPADDGSLVMVVPCPCDIPLFEIARKDTPAGKPFLLIDSSDLPTDPTYREAWTADFSEPDGFGIGAEAWFAERAAQTNGG